MGFEVAGVFEAVLQVARASASGNVALRSHVSRGL